MPHKENVSYFGDGRNEAQMVYNFSLPPLTLHAFHSGNAMILSQWAATLDTPSDEVTFFNFLASHDGIGLTPARGLLADSEVSAMAQRVEAWEAMFPTRITLMDHKAPMNLISIILTL